MQNSLIDRIRGRAAREKNSSLRAIALAHLVHAVMYALAVFVLAGERSPLLAATMDSPEWKELMAAAKAEGTLSVVAFGSRDFEPVYNRFSEKYGIKMIVAYAGGSEHADRILAERRAGRFAVDVGHVGANTVNRRLIPAGALAPIVPLLMLDEVKGPSNWYGDRLWFADPDQKFVFAHSADFEQSFEFFINTKVVKDGDIAALKSPEDFLAPQWRKKIVALSPMMGQSGNSYFRYTVLAAPYGPGWMERFITSGIIEFVSNSRLIEDGLAGGKYAFAIFPNAPPLDKMQKLGLPVKRVEHSFAGAPGIMTAGAPNQIVQVYDKAPHPNAAKLFVNWLLSKEGLTFVHDNLRDPPNPRNSLRKDVPKTNVFPGSIPKPGVNYFAVDLVPEFQSKRVATMKRIQDWYKATYAK